MSPAKRPAPRRKTAKRAARSKAGRTTPACDRSAPDAAPPAAPARGGPGHALWVNGRIVRGQDAVLSLFDRGARDGEGLMETLRVYAGEPLDWDPHMERLVLAAAELGFPVPASPPLLRDGLDALLAAGGLADAVARITVTRGVPGGRPTRTGAWIDVGPIGSRLWRGSRNGNARVVFSRRPYHPGPLGRYKTTSRLSYALASEEARIAGADETLLLGEAGDVLEGATSNVFVVTAGEVRTPPLARGILPGIVRAWVLSACGRLGIRAREADLPRGALDAADEVFLTNSVQEIVPVVVVEDRPVQGRDIGMRLRDAYRARTSPRKESA